MSRVFADTFYFLALVNRRDAAHAQAVKLGGRPDLDLLTTSWVLTEVVDALATPGHRAVAAALVRKLQRDAHITIVVATQDWFDRGLELFEARNDKAWTLTDCISFAVIRDQNRRIAMYCRDEVRLLAAAPPRGSPIADSIGRRTLSSTSRTERPWSHRDRYGRMFGAAVRSERFATCRYSRE